MQSTPGALTIFITISTFVIFLLAGMIIGILFLYQKRWLGYRDKINNLIMDHKKNLLQAQIEMQEQTFQDISREIHDNISLSLTLVKLNLNTLQWSEFDKFSNSIFSSIEILSKVINELSNLSRSMNSDIIKNMGLHKAITLELERLESFAKRSIQFMVEGNTVFMDCERELVLFRIIQETFNNILKHSEASAIDLHFLYKEDLLEVTVKDDGIGFTYDKDAPAIKNRSGILNMNNRAKAFGGEIDILTNPGAGTMVKIFVPYN